MVRAAVSSFAGLRHLVVVGGRVSGLDAAVLHGIVQPLILLHAANRRE